MRKVIGVVLGGVAYFIAGALVWTVFSWHDSVIRKLPEELLIQDTLRVVVKEAGFYFFPSDKTESGRMDENEYSEKFTKGPAGILLYSPGGKPHMSGKNFIINFIQGMLIAAFCLFILTLTRARFTTYLSRVGVVLLLGVFAWFPVHVSYWNWFFFPLKYILVVLLDYLVGFGLVGLVVAKFVPEGSSK